MKITELRCPACNGTMKISEKNPNIAVCEYCHSEYVLEREGDDARLGGMPPKMPQIVYEKDLPDKKENKMKVLLGSAGAVVLLAGVVVMGSGAFSTAGKKTDSKPLPSLNAAGPVAAATEAKEQEAEFKGIFADAAEVMFDKPAGEIKDSELGTIKWMGVRYANGGNDICVDYSTENPLENPDAAFDSVYFDRSGADMDFDALAKFTGLVKLDVRNYLPDGCLNGLHLESLSCYAESPEALTGAFETTDGLKELEISAGLETLDGLELFPSLERLTLDAYEVTDIEELAAAKNIKYLTLEKCDQVKDFSVLSVMTWLEGLSVDSENLKALTFLSKMPDLKSLELYNTGMIHLDGLSARADTLKELVIESCDGLKDCSEVSSLTGLTKLEMEVPYNCAEPDLSGLTAMEDLTVSGFKNASFLSSMPNLKKLSISSSAVEDGSVFKNLTGLEELRCTSYSGSGDNLDFIAGLPALKRLNLTGASTYYDISALFNIPTLESFCLNGMECEIDFDKLQDNPSLKEIKMDGIKLYNNVKIDGGGGILYVDWDDVVLDENTGFLAHYPNLESLSIADNELTRVEFASGLGNLKTLDISENYVTDIKPLSSAASLRTLIVTDNPVDNLRVLSEKVQIVN